MKGLRRSAYERFCNFNETNKMSKNNKKKKEELKQKLYKLIDSIDDEHLLHVLHEDVVPYVIESKGKETDEAENEPTEEQLEELDEAVAEADKGETISYEEFKKNMDEWRTRLTSTKEVKEIQRKIHTIN